MWRYLARPEVLFFFGTLQGIAPYALWHFYGQRTSYVFTISYIPLVYWITGYVAFWIGSKLARPTKGRPVALYLAGRTPQIVTATTIVVVALIIQVAILAVTVYGGIPILRFLSPSAGDFNVDVSTRANSFVGQLALFLTSQFLLDALVLLLVLSPAAGARRRRVLLIAAGVMMIASGLFLGKRQSIAIALVFVGIGSTIAFGQPLRPSLQYLGFRRPRWTARMILIVVPTALIVAFGIIATLRSGLESTGREQVRAYTQIGLINFETQCAVAGYGPARFMPMRMFRYFIPDRIGDAMKSMGGSAPPRAETSAPSGFYGELHWNLGLPGALLFAVFVGWLSKYFYYRARTRVWHLLVYSLMSWTLMMPYLYNHFLHANFLLYPSIAFALLLRVIGIPRRGRVQRPRSLTQPVEAS